MGYLISIVGKSVARESVYVYIEHAEMIERSQKKKRHVGICEMMPYQCSTGAAYYAKQKRKTVYKREIVMGAGFRRGSDE